MPIQAYLRRPNLARYPFVFVIAYGRSGSTLLQGLLNSLPGYCIRGENGGALQAVFQAHNRLKLARRQFGRKPTDPTFAWYGADRVSPRRFASTCVDAFFDSCLNVPEGARCCGFKEIRHTPKEMDDRQFTRYLDFLRRYFPGAAFIFNVRNAEDTASSGWWRKTDRAETIAVLEQTISRFKTFAESRTGTFVFDYDQLRADSGYGRGLLEFLGEDYDTETLRHVLATRHSRIA